MLKLNKQNMKYGQAIKDLRVNKMKQTQNLFAQSVGITQTYLSQIENEAKKPSTELLERIAKHVDIPLSILMWFALTEADIQKDKLESYRMLKPAADNVIKCFF